MINVSREIPYSVPLKHFKARAAMRYGPIVRACLGALATQENAPVIRHPYAHERDQFRIHWWQGNNQLTYRDNAKKELFHRIVSIFYVITIFGKFFHEIVLLSHRQFT